MMPDEVGTAEPRRKSMQRHGLIILLLVQFRYANNSNYKNDTMIRKEGFVGQEILDELKRIIEDAEVHS